MYVFGEYKFECFAYFGSLSCVSHSIDICTVAIKNIRNIRAISTNQIVDILHFNNNYCYLERDHDKTLKFRPQSCDVRACCVYSARKLRESNQKIGLYYFWASEPGS